MSGSSESHHRRGSLEPDVISLTSLLSLPQPAPQRSKCHGDIDSKPASLLPMSRQIESAVNTVKKFNLHRFRRFAVRLPGQINKTTHNRHG